MVEIHNLLSIKDPEYENYVKQLAFVHDELQFAYDENKISNTELDLISKEAMSNTQIKLGVKIKLDSDSSFGNNYAETH